jgi:aminomethyltransferase
VDLKRTPLFPLYAEYGAKTVEFGGWNMPVQFSSILQEHEAVRTKAGLFDVSHMGEFEVTGPDAESFLQYMVTNDVSKLEPGMALYSPMANEEGGCVDDLLIYRFSVDKFWVVVNAGNIDKDYEWMSGYAEKYDVHLENRSEDIALLALQGPAAESILQTLTTVDLGTVKFYRFVEGEVASIPMVISRTGYTGEDGFELYVRGNKSPQLWTALLQAGVAFGLIPCGLGARDTLRLEAKLPLYGHELTDDISPLEAGIGMFVKLDKGDFVGRSVLADQKANGVQRKVVGVQLLERGIPRADYRVLWNGKDVGFFTSGTMSPTLKTAIGLALVSLDASGIDTPLEADVRGKAVPSVVVKTPFYKRSR